MAQSGNNVTHNEPNEGEISNKTVTLTDANGMEITTVPSVMGTYFLHIKTDGIWYIETDAGNMEFTPTMSYGRGNAIVPVMIGNNWGEARQLSYNVKFINDGDGMSQTNLAGSNDGQQNVVQEASTNLANIKEIANSITCVGYGYNPAKNRILKLCTGIEVFKREVVKSSQSPQANECYYYSHNESVLDKIISASANPGANFRVAKLDFGADEDVNNTNDGESMFIQKSITRAAYSQELDFADKQPDSEVFTDGLKYYKKNFIEKFKNATADDEKKAAADEFFNVVGTHFIEKTSLGCELNYRVKIDASKIKTSTSAKSVLDFKWQQSVKNTNDLDDIIKAKVEAENGDASKLKNFVFNANVQVADSIYDASTTVVAEVMARGGDVQQLVSLVIGASVRCEDLAKWMLGADPERAVMVGIRTQPIYMLFDIEDADEKAAYDYIKAIIDKNYNIDDEKYGLKIPETITANCMTVTYGDDIPSLPYTAEGAILYGTPKLTTTATKTSSVGTYPITVEQGTVSNKVVTFVNGTLTIMPAPLTVGVEDVTITQGDVIPSFTLTYDGFRNEDSEVNSFISMPMTATTATESSPIGTYPITVSGGIAKNYTLGYTSGTLTIEVASGIQTIDSGAIKSEPISNLAGQRLTKLQPGINIVGRRKVLK